MIMSQAFKAIGQRNGARTLSRISNIVTPSVTM